MVRRALVSLYKFRSSSSKSSSCLTRKFLSALGERHGEKFASKQLESRVATGLFLPDCARRFYAL
jgi:hypothetical protein